MTDFDISGTIFDRVDFSGAIINPKRRTAGGEPGSRASVEQPDFRGSIWWEAQSIEPTLLMFLMQWYSPYLYTYTVYPPGYQIDQPTYEAKVVALCAKAGIPCVPPLKFGPLPSSPGR